MNNIKINILIKIFILHLPLILSSLIFSSLLENSFQLKNWESILLVGFIYLLVLCILLITTPFSKKMSILLNYLSRSNPSLLGQELTEVKKEYDKKKFILENISEGICAVNQHGILIFYNQKFHKKFIKPLNLLNENNLTIDTIFADHEDILQAFYRVIRLQTNESIRQVLHHHKGRDFFFDITISITENDQQDFSAVLGVFHDVTERRLTDLMRVNFVANISHEIRTPLTSILGFAEVLQSQLKENSNTLQPFINPIIQNAKKLQTLFSDLLNLSLIESERKIEKSPTSLEELFDQQINLIAAIYPNKKIKVSKNIKQDTINVDKELFEQVLTNILDNSFKYSNASDLQINIESEIAEDGSILIKLSDLNLPIPENELERIFERFYRLDNARSGLQGSGIGLSIVKQILSKHKGRAYAKNMDGKTYFCLSLPKAKTT